jgi:hypothetical protein
MVYKNRKWLEPKQKLGRLLKETIGRHVVNTADHLVNPGK